LAASTRRATTIPRVSTSRWRLRPLTRLVPIDTTGA
jgi:hypothetical protein